MAGSLLGHDRQLSVFYSSLLPSSLKRQMTATPEVLTVEITCLIL